jgi:hypothetical protein
MKFNISFKLNIHRKKYMKNYIENMNIYLKLIGYSSINENKNKFHHLDLFDNHCI